MAALALCSTLAFAPALASEPEHDHEEALESLAVAMADQPAHHAALAEHYRAKAAEARRDSARHRSLGRAYRGGKQGSGAGSFHCRRISKREAAIAAEYEALAKLHEDEAARRE
ncbi:MAG TPA: hypothetical protein VFT98_08280 [Myxococcota bacterium]|nr:hypothetical protein [Myxococcota bacterium]